MSVEHAAVAFGPFLLDRAGARLLRDGAPVEIAPRPFAVLACLAARPGQLISKDDLLDAVWGHRHVSDSVLKVAVNALRAALGEDAKSPRWIATVARRGYRFDGAAPAPAPLPTVAPISLIGRDGELAALRQALAEARLVTVVGPGGGVGKTRLALAATATMAAPADGCFTLRLDDLDDAAQLPTAVARALGLAPEAGRDHTTLARALSPLSLRLLLDNVEHLAHALAPRLAAWLAAAPGLSLLLTSQRALRLAGERLLPLAPLPSAAAQQLLLQRVQALQPHWVADAAALDDTAVIADALDGLPLALELAAARVPLLGTAGVRERLDARLRLLTGGAADAPERQRTLRAALEWSVGLLPVATQHLLQNLSVCAGGFTLPAANALAEGADEWAVLDAVQQLRDLSLLADAVAPRWRLYDSVRRLAAEQLAARDGGAAALAAQRRWLCALFEDAEQRLLQIGDDAWMAPLLPETDNLVAAVESALHGLPAAWPDEAGRLIAASSVFCIRAGLRHRAFGWLQRLREAGVDAPPLRRARAVLGAFGQLLPPAEALAACDAALADEPEHRPSRLYLQYHRAMLAQRLGDTALARSIVPAMQALLGAQPTIYERRLPAWVQATLARDAGDTAAYAAFWADMLAQSRAVGDQVEGWKAAWGLAQSLYLQGRLDTAIDLIDRAVDEMRAAGRLRAHSTIAAQAAMLHLARDASPATLARADEALRLLQADGITWWLADALPWAALWQGRADDARRLQAWADALVQQRGEGRGPVFARLRAEFDARLPAAPATLPPPASDAEARALALYAAAPAG